MKTMSAGDTAAAHYLERRPLHAPLHARRLGLLTSSAVDQTTTMLRYAEIFMVASIIARILMVLATFIAESKFLQEPSPQFWILVARALTDRARVATAAVGATHQFPAGGDRRAWDRQTASPHFLVRRISKSRRCHTLWAEPRRHVPKMRRLRRQNPAWCQAE
jgi:hypothetical protein